MEGLGEYCPAAVAEEEFDNDHAAGPGNGFRERIVSSRGHEG